MSKYETSQYNIPSAILSTSRKKGDGCVSLDISRIIAEIHLFEDIRLPFVTGIVVVADAENVLDIMGFTGTEKLDLTVKSTATQEGKEINKKFFIKRVSATDKDKQLYVFTIVEEHGFFWATTHIQNSYEGKMEKIISNILMDWMKKDVDDFYAEESVQNDIVYLCANHSLMNIIPQLTHSMCTDRGFPYFVFGTLYEDDIKIASLDSLWNEEPFNCRPFVHSPMYIQKAIEDGDKAAEFYNIINYDPQQDLSDYNLYKSGDLNANISSIDTETGQPKTINIDQKSVADVIDLLVGKSPGTGIQFLFNPSETETMNGIPLKDSLSSNPVHLKLSNQAENGQFSFAERNKKDPVNGIAVEKLWGLSMRLRNNISTVMIPIVVPGTAFFEAEASVGRTVTLKFFKSDESKQEERGAVEDKRLTGKYIITNIKHMFLQEQHLAQLVVAKFHEEE